MTYHNPSDTVFGAAYFKLLDRKVDNPKLFNFYREFLRGKNPHKILVDIRLKNSLATQDDNA